MGSELSKLFVDVADLPSNGFGFIQLLFLAGCYAKILQIGGSMIADGSELLLLVPSLAGLVGSVVLPVLGAVPDSAIVLFSGLGPIKEAQEQLAVGIGALAGSTIMLLTVPWCLAMYAGRVDFDPDGNGKYKKPHGAPKDWKKLSDGRPFMQTGVNIDDNIKHAAFAMILTSLSMFVIQIPACFANCSMKDDESDCDTPKWAAIAGGIFCIVFFCWYCFDQYRRSKEDVVVEDKILRVQQKSLAGRVMSARAMFELGNESQGSGESSPLNPATSEEKFEQFVRRIFARFDVDKSGHIDATEAALLLKALGEPCDKAAVDAFMKECDDDNDGQVDFKEFFAAMKKSNSDGTGIVTSPSGQVGYNDRPGSGFGADKEDNAAATGAARVSDDGGSDEEESDEEEMPEDLAHLPPEEQRKKVLMRAGYLMGVGTLIVLVFSDPMVDVLANLGKRTHIPAFYVSFVLAPLISNGSELIAAFSYAQKKTVASATISFSTLLGAGVMNNTVCLCIFLFLVGGRGLSWTFSAEIASIIIVELLMFGMVAICGKSMHSKWIMFVSMLLPCSIGLVAGLEAAGLD